MTHAAALSAALSDRYRIERELGQGGMAIVYLAADLRHDRQVAIKLLHPDLGAALGAERFLAEIRTTARLQHPHILPLLDSGDAGGGLLYYVMPFVRGETLRARIERERQLPIADALRIAREVADALQHAHALGIVHRDIKPENILLQDGHALVADFGIALAVRTAGGARMTQTGLSLGTPSYMSPEQAMGEKGVDARSDIYALGAMSYEMLAGEPPFAGANVQAIVARVLSERPTPLRTLRETVPPSIEHAIHTALAKLPADRFATAAEFAAALSATNASTAFTAPAAMNAAPHPRSSRRTMVMAGVLVAAVTVFAGWRVAAINGAPRDLGFPPAAAMHMGDWHRNFAVSPDGSFIIYEARIGGRTQLWWRATSGTEARPIQGTEGAFGTPRISPDGKRVAFVSNGELKVLTLADRAISAVARETNPTGGEWLDDRTLFFGTDDGRRVRWIDVGSGESRDSSTAPCMLPRMLPATFGDGERMLCGGGGEKYGTVRDLGAPMVRRTWRRAGSRGARGNSLLRGSDFRIVDDRYLLYISLDGTLMGSRIVDADSLVVGPSVPLVPWVRRASYSGAGAYDLTRDGTLVYAPGMNPDLGRLVRASRDGLVTPLAVDEAPFLRFTPSPDGTRLAAVIEGIEQQELRIHDLRTATSEVLARAFYIGAAAWSADGRRVIYKRMDGPDHEVLVEHRLDAPGEPRTILALSPPMLLQVSSWPSDDFLLVGSGGGTAGSTALLIDPTKTPARIDSLGINSLFVSISPDRRWIVHQPQGATGIVLQPWPARDRRWIIDPDGIEPRFASSTELRYFHPNASDSSRTVTLYRSTITPGAAQPAGAPQIVVRDPRFSDTPGWSHVSFPGGDELYAQSSAESTGHYVRVVPGWVKAMKRLVDDADKR